MTKHTAIAAADISAETPIVIYGNAGSGCTQKVLLTLAEKGVTAELITIDMSTGQHKGAEHVARHPFGVIPAFEIDGFVMYESRAISRYVEDRFAANPLTPATRKGRAMMEQFISVEYSYFAPGIGKIFFQKVINPMMGWPVDDAVCAKGREEIARCFDVLETYLADNDWLAGDTFSLADINFAPGIFALDLSKASDLYESRPNVAAWVARMKARPSWDKVFGNLGW
jgi:glutathione S-transferase